MTVYLCKRRGTPPVDRAKLLRRARRLLSQLDAAAGELSILLTDDEEITELNRRFCGRERTTDVLSFSQLQGPDAALQSGVLGDVVICLPAAERQARRRGVRLWDELLVLLVHGVLHLLGHEHVGVGGPRAAAMWKEQRRLVELLRT